ncbi:tumor necrosis factor receptor superfamily member 10B-like isoform X1 [Lissotriton helveticus]
MMSGVQAALLLLVVTVQVSQGRFIPENRPRSARSDNVIRQDSLDYHDQGSRGMCPAGTHRENPDETLGTRYMCTPCTDGKDYTEHKNDLTFCLPCTRCKEGQEVVSRCSPTQNTKCRCKAGTFCAPDHPCEVCVRCKTGCPEGEELISSCNATSDNLCISPTGPPATQNYVGWLVAAVILLVIIIAIGICVLRKKKIRGSLERSSGSTSKALVRQVLKCSFHSSTQEVRENKRNSRIDSADEPILPQEESNLTRPSSTTMIFPTLIPVDQNDREVLRKTFDVFVDEVHIKDWEYLMRTICLLENEILTARCDYIGIREQNYQMLLTWHRRMGDSVTVNTLLKAMRTGKLRKEADRIQDLLLKTSMYTVESES